MTLLRGLQLRLHRARLTASLKRLLAELDPVISDSWDPGTPSRLREYIALVLEDLSTPKAVPAGSDQALAHLSALGTDLALHRTIGTWALFPELTSALLVAENRAGKLSSLLRAAA